MDQKQGKGGHGLQPYDKTDGKYTTGDEYHADVDVKEDDVINEFINSPDNPEMKSQYDSLSDDDKKRYVQAIIDYYREQETDRKMHERFKEIDMGTFMDWGEKCESNTNQDDLSFFYDDYRGAGQRSFNFTKALRIGYDKTVDWYDNTYDPTLGGLKPYSSKDRSYDLMTRDQFDKGVDAMDNLTDSFEAPEDFSGFRYVDLNYIANTFQGLEEFEDLGIKKDMFGYDTFENEPSVDDIYNRLKKFVGRVVCGDGSFTSFSCVSGHTHMGKTRGKSEFKKIHILFDVPKGKNLFVSTYGGESEAVLPRDTSFYIKDVQKEPGQYYDENGNLVSAERIVLLYGVR
jgi:hypothetical protein